MEDLLLIEDRVWKEIEKLENCEYNRDIFGAILSNIQDAVDELNLASFSNLARWVKIVEEELEKKLVVRLKAGLKAGTEKLLSGLKPTKDEDEAMEDNEPVVGHKLGGDPVIPVSLTLMNIVLVSVTIFHIECVPGKILEQIFLIEF